MLNCTVTVLPKEAPKLSDTVILTPHSNSVPMSEPTIDPNNLEDREMLELIERYLQIEGFDTSLQSFQKELSTKFKR